MTNSPRTDGQTDWWQQLFADSAWQAVQRTIHPPEQSAEEAQHVADLLELREGDAVLDAPCGDGRIGVELGVLGARVTGVDITAPFLSAARAASAERGISADWLKGDLRAMPVPDAAFDAALCFWGSFGYFGPEGDRQFAAEVARSLKTGGRWLIDTHSVETLMTRWSSKSWFGDDDPLVLEDRHYDLVTGTIETHWTLIQGDGRRSTHTSRIRLYAVHELMAMLSSVGFTAFALHGDLHGEPFELGSHRLALVARK